MRRGLAVLILVVTAVLLAVGRMLPSPQVPVSAAQAASATPPKLYRSPQTPDEAVISLLTAVSQHNYAAAYSYVANTDDVSLPRFTSLLAGSHDSLRTYSWLEDFQVRPLHQTDNEGQVRATLHWSTAVGPLYSAHDLQTVRKDGVWKVIWPAAKPQNTPPQVIPVSYLRWDVIQRGPGDDWGTQNVDLPRVRIISMNPIQSLDRVIVVGEVVNEDTVPAFTDLSATLIDASDQEIAEESAFDKISHTLLPKQVSPYRIDFPGMRLDQIKKIRMNVRTTLISAKAEDTVGVMQAKLENNDRGAKVLKGDLLNESGRIVNIAQVLAAFYDAHGKVIWVADGYVDHALMPQVPQSFAVTIPDAIAAQVNNFRITINHYNSGNS